MERRRGGSIGIGAENVAPMVAATIASFLDGVRGGSCPLPVAKSSMRLQAK